MEGTAPIRRLGLKIQSRDTHPQAEAVQIALIRKASHVDRLASVWSLTQTVAQLAFDGIRRSHPGASRDEVLYLFVSIHYGQTIADRLSSELERRRQ